MKRKQFDMISSKTGRNVIGVDGMLIIEERVSILKSHNIVRMTTI